MKQFIAFHEAILLFIFKNCVLITKFKNEKKMFSAILHNILCKYLYFLITLMLFKISRISNDLNNF